MNPTYKSLLHATIAGLLAAVVYVTVAAITLSGHGASTDILTHCGSHGDHSSLDGITCLLEGGLYFLVNMITIALPLALFVAAIYLKLAKRRLIAAIMIPLGATALAGSVIAIFWQVANFEPPIWALLAILVLSHTVFGSVGRRKPVTQVSSQPGRIIHGILTENAIMPNITDVHINIPQATETFRRNRADHLVK